MLAVCKANKNERIELEPELEVSWNQVDIKNYVPNKIKQLLETASESQERYTVRKSVVLEHNKRNQGFEIEF